jgi:hypothetical protein
MRMLRVVIAAVLIAALGFAVAKPVVADTIAIMDRCPGCGWGG